MGSARMLFTPQITGRAARHRVTRRQVISWIVLHLDGNTKCDVESRRVAVAVRAPRVLLISGWQSVPRPGVEAPPALSAGEGRDLSQVKYAIHTNPRSVALLVPMCIGVFVDGGIAASMARY